MGMDSGANERLKHTFVNHLTDLKEISETSLQHQYLKACAFITAKYDSRTQRTPLVESIHHEYDLISKRRKPFKKSKDRWIYYDVKGSCDILVRQEGGVLCEILEAGLNNYENKIKYPEILQSYGFNNTELSIVIMQTPIDLIKTLLEKGFDRVIVFKDPVKHKKKKKKNRKKHQAKEDIEYWEIVREWERKESENAEDILSDKNYMPIAEYWLEKRNGKKYLGFKPLTIESLL